LPRAIDLRQLEADYDPNRSGTEFHLGAYTSGFAEMWQKILAKVQEDLEASVIAAIEELLGIDLSVFDFGSISSIDDIIAAITGLIFGTGGDPTDPLAVFFANVRDFFTGIDFTDGTFDVADAIDAFQTIFLDAGKLFNLEDIGEIAQAKIADLTTNLSTLFGHWSSVLSGFGLGSVPAWVSDLLGTKSTASTAGTNATTALGNFTSILSSFGLGTVGDWITDLLGTKSTASTAGTNASTGLSNWTSFLSGGSWANIGAANTSLNTTGTNASTAFGNFTTLFSNFSVANLAAWSADLLGTRSTSTTAGTNATTAISNAGTALTRAQDWIDGFFKGFTGDDNAVAVAVADAQSQVAAIAETQAALAAALAALQSTADGTVNSGVSFTDSFDRVAAGSLGGASYWSETVTVGSGTAVIECNGTDAVPNDGATNVVKAFRFRSLHAAGSVTTTSYQKLVWTCGSLAPQGPSGASNYWHIRLLFRMNTAETQYGFLEFTDNNKAQWGYRNAGSDTYVGSQFACARPSPGTQMIVEAGTSSGVRFYKLTRNTTVIDTWNDSSSALVTTGASNLGWGWGAQFGTWSFVTSNNQVDPPSTGSVSVADNVPAAVLGTFCRVVRTSGSNSAATSGTSEQTLPASVFDSTPAQISADLTFTQASNRITVTKPGPYIFTFRFDTATGLGISAQTTRVLMYVNGSIKQRGPDQQLEGSSTVDGFGYTFMEYLQAGDYVQPGVWFQLSSAVTMYGDASGTITYMSLTRIPVA
jgi:hypothetical protein